MKYKVLQFRVFHRIHSLLKDRILFSNLIFHDFLINWVQVIHNTTELFYFNFFFSLFLSFIFYFHKDKFQFLYFLKRFRKVQKGLERFRKVQKGAIPLISFSLFHLIFTIDYIVFKRSEIDFKNSEKYLNRVNVVQFFLFYT